MAVLIPLPFISFSRIQNAVYKCSVCPSMLTTASYYQMLQHRESGTLRTFSLKNHVFYSLTSDDHRRRYGEIFRDNNYVHFPDMVALNQDEISTPHCFKCDRKFESYADLLMHVRSHELPERDPDGSGSHYCEECKVDTRAGHPSHKTSIAIKQTIFCTMCSMRIFRSKMVWHFKHAHPNDYFRYY